MSSEKTTEPAWALEDVLRHRVGSEWKLVEHVGGPEDDWIAECVESNWRSPGFGGKVGERKLFHREYMGRAFTRIRRCPDGGICHHDCTRTECFRVGACAPLSAYGEDWTPEDVERFGGAARTEVLPRAMIISMLNERELTCRANAAQEHFPEEHRLRLTAMADAYEDAAALLTKNLPSVDAEQADVERELKDPLVLAFASLDPSRRQGIYETLTSSEPETWEMLHAAIARIRAARD